MSTTETTSPINAEAVNETHVKELAEKNIAFTCAKHGVTRDLLKPEVIATAYADARNKVLHETELSQDAGYQALLQEREKNRQLELQIQALKVSKPVVNESGNSGHAKSSRLPDSEVIKAKLGVAAWNSLTIDGRLIACGVQPSEVTASTREEIAEIFGRKADSKRASDLYIQDRSRYQKLKTIANVLNLAGR